MLKSGARVLLEAPPAGSLDERFYQVYGDRPDLVPVSKQAAGITITGFVAALGEQGPARGPQHVFVNQRIVRDRTIAHAIQRPTASRRSRSAARKSICSSSSGRIAWT